MSAYKFECDAQHQRLDLYYEDEAIAIDMEPQITTGSGGSCRPSNVPASRSSSQLKALNTWSSLYKT